MTDTAAKTPFLSRRSLLWLAWIMLAGSLLIPAPAGSFVNGQVGISALYVVGKAILWSEAAPGSAAELGFWQGACLSLALLSNVAFLYSVYLPAGPAVSRRWKMLLLSALVIDAVLALLVPDFARLPAYWIWLLAMGTLVLAFLAFPGAPAAAPAKARAQARRPASAIDAGEVPPLVWALIGFTVFWLAVSAGNHAFPPKESAGPAEAALTTYVTDRAGFLSSGQAAQLSGALENFEKLTSNQIVVATYRGAPGGAVEDFTIHVAERSRLGRKGIDNGAILFLFPDLRTARLEVGYGLEGTLTDVQAHRILDEVLAPAMARGASFEGVDAALAAVFELVQDDYRQGRMPGTLTVLWRRLKAEWPRVVENAWPAVSALGLDARIGITFFGALLATLLWSALRSWRVFGVDIVRLIGNAFARRPLATGIEAFDLGEVWDSLKLLVWALVGLVSAAGAVVLAAGGTFGGAGTQVHW